jgi:guanidinoacetate N-methyltransferase
MKYGEDKNGKDILIDKTGYQVMMEWEKPYMSALIERLNPSGDVLEVGFGLGYSATEIQKYDIKTHTIIENNPVVLEELKKWAKKQPHQVNVVSGDWQTTLRTLSKFDAVFFDDSPSEDNPDEASTRVYDFYYQILRDHANENCRMTWYCDVPIYWVSHPFSEWSNRKFSVDIPENAKYIAENLRENQEVYMPLVTFPYGSVDVNTKLVFDRFLEFSVLTD